MKLLIVCFIGIIDCNNVCIEDGIRKCVARIPIELLLQLDFQYPNFVEIDAFYNGFNWVDDTTIVCTNCLYFNDFGLDKEMKELFYLDITGTFRENYLQKSDGVFAADYSGGVIASNPSKHKFY